MVALGICEKFPLGNNLLYASELVHDNIEVFTVEMYWYSKYELIWFVKLTMYNIIW